tara:strand:+ start:538 stop:660 length:123 start_codon:yes stop_codon:yes gene_type:complete
MFGKKALGLIKDLDIFSYLVIGRGLKVAGLGFQDLGNLLA